eukprot:Pgem_evm1s7490
MRNKNHLLLPTKRNNVNIEYQNTTLFSKSNHVQPQPQSQRKSLTLYTPTVPSYQEQVQVPQLQKKKKTGQQENLPSLKTKAREQFDKAQAESHNENIIIEEVTPCFCDSVDVEENVCVVIDSNEEDEGCICGLNLSDNGDVSNNLVKDKDKDDNQKPITKTSTNDNKDLIISSTDTTTTTPNNRNNSNHGADTTTTTTPNNNNDNKSNKKTNININAEDTDNDIDNDNNKNGNNNNNNTNIDNIDDYKIKNINNNDNYHSGSEWFEDDRDSNEATRNSNVGTCSNSNLEPESGQDVPNTPDMINNYDEDDDPNFFLDDLSEEDNNKLREWIVAMQLFYVSCEKLNQETKKSNENLRRISLLKKMLINNLNYLHSIEMTMSPDIASIAENIVNERLYLNPEAIATIAMVAQAAMVYNQNNNGGQPACNNYDIYNNYNSFTHSTANSFEEYDDDENEDENEVEDGDNYKNDEDDGDLSNYRTT